MSTAGLWSNLEFLIPVAIGAVGTVIASAFVTSRRLRSELRDESEMLDRLPPGARAELRADVKRRTLLLVSINRFPPFTRVDFLALVGLAAGLAFGAFTSVSIWNGEGLDPNLPSLPLLALVLVAGWTSSTWVTFYKPWSRRAVGRLKYVAKHLGMDEALPVAQMLYVGDIAAGLVGTLLIGGVAGAIAAAGLHSVGVDDGLCISAAALTTTFAMLLGGRVDDSQLTNYTRLLVHPNKLKADFGDEAFKRLQKEFNS